MQLILLIVIIVVVVLLVKKKNEGSSGDYAPKPTKLDPNNLPDSILALRKLSQKCVSKDDYQGRDLCNIKICELGAARYREGLLVIEPGDENDVNALLADLLQCNAPTPAKQVEYRQLGLEIHDKYSKQSYADPVLDEKWKKGSRPTLVDETWIALARIFIDGAEGVARDPDQARTYLRSSVLYHQALDMEIPTNALEMMMEIPPVDEEEQIFKMIALGYGSNLVKLRLGAIQRNCRYQPYQQAAELLYQLDWRHLSSPDIHEMLAVYQKGVAEGNAYAQYMLGTFYLDGHFVEEDQEKGVALLKQAAAANLCFAAEKLSHHYDTLSSPVWNEGASKQQRKQYDEEYHAWLHRSSQLFKWVEKEYANSFSKYLKNSANQPTQLAKQAPAPTQSGTYAAEDSQNGGSLSDLPTYIYDDQGREWCFDGLYGDGAKYVLSSYEDRNTGDLGDYMGESVCITKSQIRGRTASTALRSFHW